MKGTSTAKNTNRKLLYLLNPISGTKKKPALVKAINDLTAQAGFAYEILHTRADGIYTDLPEYILQNNISDVVICGGDGTVSTITAYLLKTNVNIGIIPTGSGNGLALTARIPYSTCKALAIIFDGHASTIDGFMINDKFSCMMCGFGNDAEIAHEFALTKVRGLKTYLRLSVKKYFSLKPYHFTITANNITKKFEAFFITVSNSNQFGNYVTIAPRASLNDGLLDVVVVKKMNKLALPFALFYQITGNNKLTEANTASTSQRIHYYQVKNISIVNHDLAPIHIDGEPHAPAEHIEISIIPNAFRLLQPYRRRPVATP